MVTTMVCSTPKHEMCLSQLVYVEQPLKGRMIDDLKFAPSVFDETMYRIEKLL